MNVYGLAAVVIAALSEISTAQPAAGVGGRYLEVPLKGEVGKDITAPGVRDAIRAAKQHKCDCIVFEIDTPGGRVADADAIARIMDSERAGLKYYAVVTRAISAAVWPLSRMDRIFFAPGAAAGAAVAFTYHESTGQFEVDAKFNAAMTAQVAAAADAHGQSGAVYRAMMLKDARLFRWKAKDGSIALASERPADQPSAEEIDTDQTVLAWTTEQAVANGFGTLMPSADAAALKDLLHAETWDRAGDPAAQPMARWKNEIARDAAAVDKAKDRITSTRDDVVKAAEHVAGAIKLARAADPAKLVSITYREGSGTLTAETQAKWREQSDAAVRQWNDALAAITDLVKAQRRASQAVDDFNTARAKEFSARLYDDKPDPLKLDPVDTGLDLPVLSKQVDEEIRRISAARLRTRL